MDRGVATSAKAQGAAPGPRRAGPASAVGVVLLAGAALAAMVLFTWRGWQLARDAFGEVRVQRSLAERGVPVGGVVLATSNLGLVTRGGTGKGNTSPLRQYVGTVTFRWRLEGRDHQATEEIVEPDLALGDGALRERLARLPPGGEVALRCAPEAPDRCRLDEGTRPSKEPLALALAEAVLGVLMMALAPCLAAWGLWRRRGRRP